MSEWERIKAIDPFFRFRRYPNQDEVFNSLHDRQVLGNQDHARARPGRREVGKVAGHRAAIVRDQKAAFTRRLSQYRLIIKAVQTCFVSRLKINRWDRAMDCSYAGLIEIGVSLKADLHD